MGDCDIKPAAASRRFGPQDSTTSNSILDATERVLRSKGYAAATSRTVAEEAGIKQGLVYYYFKTMDELLLATFKRRTTQGLERLAEQVASARPVQSVWEDLSKKVDGRIVFEFVALANHHEGIRQEVARFVKESRRLQSLAIQQALDGRDMNLGPASASALAFVMYAATLIMARESANGITDAHDEVNALFETLVNRLS